MTGSKQPTPEQQNSDPGAQEVEIRALRARIRRLEQRLEDIQRSRLWRWSAPLRSLASALVRVRQRLGRAVVSTATGRRWYRRLRGRNPPPVHATGNGPDREVFRRQAEDELNVFLDGDQRLVFNSPEAPRLSILLVLYNQAALTLTCLRSIHAFGGDDCELVIVDNASSDRTSALLERIDGVELMVNAENRGFVHAVNQAAERANGESLLLLNNDAELYSGSLEAALKALYSADDIGAVGGRIVLADGRLQEAGSIIWNDGTTSGYGRGRSPEEPEFMFRREVDYCSGAFLLTPARLFAELEGLDTAYAPAYYEESDYCFRLRQAGYRTLYEPRARISHFEFASSVDPDAALELQRRHREIFRERHAGLLQQQPERDRTVELFARTANTRLNVLWIDDRVPHSSLGAGYPRARQMLNALANQEFNLTLYPLQIESDDWPAVRASLDARIEVMLGHGIEYLSEFLKKRAGFFDRVVVSRAINMKIVAGLLQRNPDLLGRARLIYDTEAIEARREIHRHRLIGKPLDQDQARRRVADEIELARPADVIITVSEPEANEFRNAGFEQVSVLGHALEPTLTRTEFDQRQGFLFVGALRDPDSPNADSLRWFLDEVAGKLQAELHDDFKLYIAGDASPGLIDRYSSDRVHFLGRVEALETMYAGCRVFVAPTRFAAGIPHKIHEAAAAGIPVVATSLLAEQLGWQNERELLVADQPGEFTRACARLYRDPELWQAIRDRAARSVAADCDPRKFADELVAIIR